MLPYRSNRSTSSPVVAAVFSILFPFLLESTPDNLAPIGVFGPLEIDLARAFIFLPRLGGIYEMTSRQSCIHEDLLSQRLVSSGIPETSTSRTLGSREDSAAPGGLPALQLVQRPVELAL